MSPGGAVRRCPIAIRRIIIHLVFSTKERRKTISKAMQPRLWPYMSAICQKNKIFVYAIGGMEDHVHILMRLSPPWRRRKPFC